MSDALVYLSCRGGGYSIIAVVFVADDDDSNQSITALANLAPLTRTDATHHEKHEELSATVTILI